MTVLTGPRQLPDLESTRELVLPRTGERTLANGLTVIAIERRSVPLVEVRLRVPTQRAVLDPLYIARSAVLAQTVFSGTADMSTGDIAAALQTVGGAMSASLDPDRLLVTGNGLSDGIGRLLGILAEVLSGASYPDSEVATERGRLVDRIQVARSQPSHQARVVLLRRLYGKHPYALQTPDPAQVAEVDHAQVAELHSQRVRPNGATLVIVGDLEADGTLDLAEAALGAWTGAGAREELPPAPPVVGGPLQLADRPGSVQSSLRLALPAVGRTHPDLAALQLANLVFGGYFSSRWTENIREDKGYTYSPHSSLEHSLAGSTVLLSAEVGTETTAPALLETWYELGRMATIGPRPDELEQARQYALGSLLLGMSTQSGLGGLASTFAGYGLRLDFLAEHARRLASATVDDVAAAAATYLAPARAAVVVLGDAARVGDPLRALSTVEIVSTDASTGDEAGQPGA
jgi:predicted Zn-dependent peptidase